MPRPVGFLSRLDLAKKSIQNIVSSSLLIVEVKPVKSRITKNITTFQIKLIRRLIYVNQFTFV